MIILIALAAFGTFVHAAEPGLEAEALKLAGPGAVLEALKKWDYAGPRLVLVTRKKQQMEILLIRRGDSPNGLPLELVSRARIPSPDQFERLDLAPFQVSRVKFAIGYRVNDCETSLGGAPEGVTPKSWTTCEKRLILLLPEGKTLREIGNWIMESSSEGPGTEGAEPEEPKFLKILKTTKDGFNDLGLAYRGVEIGTRYRWNPKARVYQEE